ncbi:MAG: class I SAM-dependent methyltransferase [bacterium]|nr:class I SAM-dependent methyltransferase [bacterium]
MRKITKPCESKESKYIFSEGINYFKTGNISIWGSGDKKTLDVLKRIKIKGKWLNLAAGDGRYNLYLLKKVDFVIVSDIDKGALSKLWHTTPLKYRHKLDTKIFDINNKFPFHDNLFDGVFCTGVLHLFPKKILRKIVSEIDRILKPKGRVIIDFATNIKRTLPNGKLLVFDSEPLYSLSEAKEILKKLFKNYRIKMYESKFVEDVKKSNPPYVMNCKFIILIADKK